jgi:NAD(P)H-hydrate epimerase
MEALLPEEVRAIDENAEFLGISRLQLMENAGRGVADAILKLRPKKVLILAYIGNKGGDGFVAARHLAASGTKVKVILLAKPEQITTPEAKSNYDSLAKLNLSVEMATAASASELSLLRKEIGTADILVDAMLGTGARGELRDPIREAVEICNSSKSRRVAIDIPTGIDPSTGKPSEPALKADITLTHHKPKEGLLAKEAAAYVGDLEVINIGIPPEAEVYVGPGDLGLGLKQRETFSHKGRNGRILVVGGSSRYAGAPALAALAALRVGIDLAVVAVPQSIVAPVRAFSPNLIIVPLPSEDIFDQGCLKAVNEEAEIADAVVFGMGLGLDPLTKEAVKKFADHLTTIHKPAVIDADALKALGESREKLKLQRCVLTPHAGEFFSLTGAQLQSECEVGWEGRLDLVREWAARLNSTILLKSRYDIITNGLRFKIKTIGNPGMTAGGTGDVLSGIVGAMMSRGTDPFRAAAAGSFLNSYAGDHLAACMGQRFTALDLIEEIPVALSNLGL